MKKIMISSALLMGSMGCIVSYAESLPRSVAADHHVKVVQYDPNNVVILQGRYGYQTQITFAANESIKNVSIGDSVAWQAVAVQNNLFIKPMAGSQTDMTVLTNLNSYSFQLDSSQTNTSPTYKLVFNYPEGGLYENGNQEAVGTFDPAKLNWKYSFTGDRSIAPIEAFDNGQFTFFKFKNNGESRLPAIFVVDKDRHQTLVNYHMQGEYLVVHSVARQFTLRDGTYVTSVYNDLAIGDWKSI